MQADPVLRRAARDATSIGADGASVLLAARLAGTPLPARVAGADLATDLLEDAAARGWRVALLGASREVIDTVARKVADDGVRVVWHRDGYFTDDEESDIAGALAAARPDLLLVGMGSPRTEHFVVRHGRRMGVPLVLGVGGTFDVLAGRVRRAPAWLGPLGLEGVWRFAGEPRKRLVPALVHPPLFLASVALGRALPPDDGAPPHLPSPRTFAARVARVPPTEVPYRLGQVARRLADVVRAKAPAPTGDAEVWHRDPATGFRWPELPAARITVVGGADPRPLWEAARLQEEALAAVEHPTDEAPLTRVRSFLRACPPGWGVHWTSAMEAALRLVSLVRIAEIHPEAGLDDAIAAHARWVLTHPSRHTSANNHRVAELAGLAVAGTRPGADPHWWATAQDELPAVFTAQLHPDGGGVEQSVAYLAQVLDWGSLARRCGLRGLGAPLLRGARFLSALTDAEGFVPAIGDDDGGRVVATTHGPEHRYAGTVARRILAELGAEPTDDPVATFPDTGLTVLRDGLRRVVFDHGPLGAGLAAHAHADALSCWIHDGHGPIVVARGTGSYQGDAAQRAFGRGTRSHPTAVVAGADQSLPHDHPFLWRTTAQVWCEGLHAASRTVSGAHDGYLARHGVVHRRTVTLDPHQVAVSDRFDGPARRHVSLVWPLAPDLDVTPEEGPGLVVRRAGAPVLRLVPPDGFTIRFTRGGPRPGVGWQAVGYGKFVEASAVVIDGRPAPGDIAKTLFVWV